ncbi:MAG: tRNA glutamyl-Q(34) synthetase GluQRS [Pseudomonadota bacterium]
MITERFAPSPTGLLHLGHAFSALTAYDAAKAAKGRFILRIEDIDAPRASRAHENQMLEDLTWLGVAWEAPVLRQSDRMNEYQAAFDHLARLDLLYPCSCTRGDINRALSAPQDGDAAASVYPGTCRNRKMASYQDGDALRLDMARAVAGYTYLAYCEIGDGSDRLITKTAKSLVETIGDFVIARKDIKTSYNLSVVVDDAYQNVTHVTRGEDMVDVTPVHVLLQMLLSLPTPIYRHHCLIRDQDGKRLAKRHDALSLKKLREDGATPTDIREMVGLPSTG